MPKKYTDAFVADVKAMFPDYARLHEALDAGSEMVGRYLDDARADIPAATVLSLLDTDQAELRRQAERQVKINQLYKTWLDLATA
jgi:hypothetical protein